MQREPCTVSSRDRHLERTARELAALLALARWQWRCFPAVCRMIVGLANDWPIHRRDATIADLERRLQAAERQRAAHSTSRSRTT